MFRAYDPERDRLVAIKLFKLDLPPERVHQLVAEFERLIAVKLAHPSIAAAIATGMEGVMAYLAQDYVVAESLDTAVRQHGPLAPADALRVAAQVGAALDCAAAAQIDHGVLHPRDVLMPGDETRLTGLGIARALERVGVPTPVRRPYTAPERIVGSEWDRRADVFGLAAMLHEMLWARRPAAVGDEAADSLTEIAGGDLARLRSVFGRALAEDPARRFDTALEFTDALKEAFPNVPVAARAPAPKPRRTPQKPIEHEPHLPLDAPAGEPAPGGAMNFGPALPRVDDLDLRPVEPDRYSVVETPAAVVPLTRPSSGYEPPAAKRMASIAPPSSTDSYQSATDGALAVERSRSALSPLAFALIIGAALGFAAGYGIGARDGLGRPVQTADAATQAALGGSDASEPPREWTEDTINDASKAASEGNRDVGLPNAAVVDGSLLVRSAPAGARVSIDGREYGKTPLTIRELSRGLHRVRVSSEGYATEELNVEITPAQPASSMIVRLSPAAAAARSAPSATSATSAPAATSRQSPPATAARTAAVLSVDSRPTGARVFVDGRLVGTTPLVVPEVAVGEHSVALERDGYRRWTSSVRISASERNRVAASLDR